jgi:hypothetical protein
VDIVAALYTEQFDVRPVPGPSTRLDLRGVHFSLPAPGPLPVTIEPHLVVLVRCPPDARPDAVLEVRFLRDGRQIARNVQPITVEPGRFGYRLVRAELSFEEHGTVEAHCRVDEGHVTVVPLTLLPPPT